MKTRVLTETHIELSKKLINHEKGLELIKFFYELFPFEKDMLNDSLYYISDRGDFGEGPEVINVYFLNIKKDIPDVFHICDFRKKHLPKYDEDIYLSEDSKKYWNSPSENVNDVFDIRFSYFDETKTTNVMELTKDTDYFDFKSFVYQNIKNIYKEFINTTYFDKNRYLIEGKEVIRNENVELWSGENKFKVMMLLESLFPNGESGYYKRIVEEKDVFNENRVKQYLTK